MLSKNLKMSRNYCPISANAKPDLYTSPAYTETNVIRQKIWENMRCLFAKSQTSDCNFAESKTSSWVFFTFFKLYKWYQIAQSITRSTSKVYHGFQWWNRAKNHVVRVMEVKALSWLLNANKKMLLNFSGKFSRVISS